MKTIKVKFLDWWAGFDSSEYVIDEILRNEFNVVESDNPDYVISSVYSKEALKYDCIRIILSPENFCPDFNLFDYAVGFEKLEFGDRYAMVPNYLLNPKYVNSIDLMKQKHLVANIAGKTDFCSYVVSNGVGDEMRTLFFEELSKYKKVNSGGKYKNNIGMPDGVPNKLEFQKKHKFSICFENSSHPGYITEKLMEGFAAGTVPIYWGAPNVTDIYNEDAMVVVKGVDDIPRAIEQIKRIDQNDTLYTNMLKQPALIDKDYLERISHNLDSFLKNIFSMPLDEARRRPDSTTVKNYYTEFCKDEGKNDCKKKKGFLKGLF